MLVISASFITFTKHKLLAMTLIKSASGFRGTVGGKVGENLTPLDVVNLVSAYGSWLLSQPETPAKVVIGRDARTSGLMVSQLTSATLCALGITVVDLGLSTTPTVELSVKRLQAGGGIIVTASHNPAHWNALKLLGKNGEYLTPQHTLQVIETAEKGQFYYRNYQNLGQITHNSDALDHHIAQILALPLVDAAAIKQRNFRIAVDAINSSGSFALPKLLAALGVEQVEVINADAHGKFAHNPEPLPENLTEICNLLAAGNYDLGIVVDPDVDRLAFISEDGTPFGEEYTLVAVADYVLKHQKGNTVSNLSSTRALRDITEKANGHYFAAAVGEANVVAKMKETQAILGGEGNGGVIYPALHYGRDALVGTALFLSHLAKFEGTAKMLRKTYPEYHISKNKIELTKEMDVENILDKIAEKYQKNPINREDGVKIDFENEWVHLRKSNTEPIIRVYSESDSSSTSLYLANKIIADIKEIITFKAED